MDLRPDKHRPPQGGFTVGGGRQQPLMRRRELWLVFLMAMVAVLLVSYVVDYIRVRPVPRGPSPEEQVDRLGPMPLPDLTALADELDGRELPERDRETVRLLLERPELVERNVFGPTALGLAWLDARLARDADEPPLFQRFNGEDLMRGQLTIGSPFLCDGILMDLQRIGEYEWGTVELAPERYALVRADEAAEAVIIGESVRLAGRFLGRLPYGEATEDRNDDGRIDEDDRPRIALLGCRELIVTPPELPLAEAIALPKIGVDGSLPADGEAIFDEIDDIHPSLELRPYYYLLGMVSRHDNYTNDPYAGAVSAVGTAMQIHDAPSRFRGDPMHFQGYVLYSFEDHQVARDQPFGIERVLRIVCYNTIWGPYRERDIEGQVTTHMANVPVAFELAVIGDEPPPPKGAFIKATGRFLKVHGVPAKANARLDEVNEVTRQSDNVYFNFLVCNTYRDDTPADIDWSPLRWAFLILLPLTVLWVVYLEISDNRKQAGRPERVRRLRKTRRALGIDRSGKGEAVDGQAASSDGGDTRPDEDPPGG